MGIFVERMRYTDHDRAEYLDRAEELVLDLDTACDLFDGDDEHDARNDCRGDDLFLATWGLME